MTKILIVQKYPDAKTVARVIETDTDSLPSEYVGELMTVDEYNAWKQLPEQVASAELYAQQALAQLEQERLAERNKKITEYMTVWECTEAQAIYELTRNGDI